MSVTLAEIREQIRERADMQKSKFVSDAEINRYANLSYQELYDLIVSRFEDYYSVHYEVNVGVNAKTPVPLDFYKLRGVDIARDGGGDNWLTLSKWIFGERNQANRTNNSLIYGVNNVQYRLMGNEVRFLPESQAQGLYRIWYIPKTPTLKDGVSSTLTVQGLKYSSVDMYSDGELISIEYLPGAVAGSEVVTVTDNLISVEIDDQVSTATNIATAIQNSQEASALVTVAIIDPAVLQDQMQAQNLQGGVIQVDLDGVNGWEEYVIIDAAIKCLIKEESDTSMLMAQKQQMMARIEAMATNRDAGDPERVTDTNRGYGDNWGGGFGGYGGF